MKIKEKAKERTKELLLYLQTSEVPFLLLFSVVVGVGSGFGAVIFRWLINSFKAIFFEKGHNLLQFMGP
jgi:hypothetical protein